jgi:hypothetical protein
VEIEENNEITVTSTKWGLDILSAMWKHLQLNFIALSSENDTYTFTAVLNGQNLNVYWNGIGINQILCMCQFTGPEINSLSGKKTSKRYG